MVITRHSRARVHGALARLGAHEGYHQLTDAAGATLALTAWRAPRGASSSAW